MRVLAAVLLLALVVAGCGGGGSSGEATTTSPLDPIIAAGLDGYERAVADDVAGVVLLSEVLLADGTELAARTAATHPAGVYPSAHAPDGDWTARELLEWIRDNGRPQASVAAIEALGALP